MQVTAILQAFEHSAIDSDDVWFDLWNDKTQECDTLWIHNPPTAKTKRLKPDSDWSLSAEVLCALEPTIERLVKAGQDPASALESLVG